MRRGAHRARAAARRLQSLDRIAQFRCPVQGIQRAEASVSARDEDVILRFRASERHLHWALAIPFMISWTTAVVLVTVYNPHPERPYRFVFSWIHRSSGIWLSLLPPLIILRHRHELPVYLRNVREAWRWTLDDLKWLALMGPAAMLPRIRLPHQGKFNAAEKINFMTLMATYPIYIATGLLIWMPGVALFAWLVHFSLALISTPLMLGHIFMATINPDTRVGLSGMLTGFVSREWAKHHYHRWYVETFEGGVESDPHSDAEKPAVPVLPPIAVPRPTLPHAAAPAAVQPLADPM